MKTLLLIVILSLSGCATQLGEGLYLYGDPGDFTDSGVGCLDDCLDPAS